MQLPTVSLFSLFLISSKFSVRYLPSFVVYSICFLSWLLAYISCIIMSSFFRSPLSIAAFILCLRLLPGNFLLTSFSLFSRWNPSMTLVTFEKLSSPFVIHFPPSACMYIISMLSMSYEAPMYPSTLFHSALVSKFSSTKCMAFLVLLRPLLSFSIPSVTVTRGTILLFFPFDLPSLCIRTWSSSAKRWSSFTFLFGSYGCGLFSIAPSFKMHSLTHWRLTWSPVTVSALFA